LDRLDQPAQAIGFFIKKGSGVDINVMGACFSLAPGNLNDKLGIPFLHSL